jgi:ribosome-binding factor A
MFRIEKVNSLIQQELGNIFLREVDIFPGTLLTITRVECSTSLFHCKVYISVVPEDNFDNVLSLLKRHIYDIQQILNKKLKMRPVPKIEFLKETKTKEAGRIEELLLKIEKESIEKNE